jgi:hypothetical protein
MCRLLHQNKLSPAKEENTYHRVGNGRIQEAYPGTGSDSFPRNVLDSCRILTALRAVITNGTSRSGGHGLGKVPAFYGTGGFMIVIIGHSWVIA